MNTEITFYIEKLMEIFKGIEKQTDTIAQAARVIPGAVQKKWFRRLVPAGLRSEMPYLTCVPGWPGTRRSYGHINAYGITSITIDTVLECKKRGVTTITVTSKSFALTVPRGQKFRHPGGKNLFEKADFFIDNQLPLGDAVISLAGLDQKVGSTSTFCNCFVMNCLVTEIVREMLSRGIKPSVFVSANMPGWYEHDKNLEEHYFSVIKHLM